MHLERMTNAEQIVAMLTLVGESLPASKVAEYTNLTPIEVHIALHEAAKDGLVIAAYIQVGNAFPEITYSVRL